MSPQEPHTGGAFPAPFRIGEWSIDPALDEISRGTEVVKLEPRMMRLLCRLAESRGQVVSTQQLLDSVWSGVVVGPASIYQAVSALRKILGDTDSPPTYIATVLRKGYRLVATVGLAAEAVTGQDAPALPAVASRAPARRGAYLALAALAVAVAVLAIALIALRRPATTASSAHAAATEPPSIAIVLFQSGPDESSALFAQCITDILHNRMARQGGLRVVSVASAFYFRDPRLDVRDTGRRLHVQYLLRGNAVRAADQLRVDVSLIETTTGSSVWSQEYVRDAAEIAALREDIVASVGKQLQVEIRPSGNLPVDLAAYEIFMRGRLAIARHTSEGYSAAKAIFHRTTALYPDFARGYHGLAEALLLLSTAGEPATEGERELLIKSLDRALELDPEFGEAMIDRAGFDDDPVEAEKKYRRGLEFVPNYDLGAYRFARFLASRGRLGEAIEVIDEGLRRDPASSSLLQTKADILALGRGDIAGHDRTLRELLAMYPDFPSALVGLGWSRYVWSAETAEGIRYLEREIARDSHSLRARHAAAAAYLDVNDAAAAAAVANEMPLARLEIAQFRREPHAINALPPSPEPWTIYLWGAQAFSSYGEALRDEARATGNYAAALAVFEKARSEYQGPPTGIRGLELAHAHTLILSGAVERGRALAKSLLQLVDAEQAGRPPDWFARDRASIYAMLGDDERALAELAASARRMDLARWWYTAELDPVFAHLRQDPRFQALTAMAEQHRRRQRALLDDMRKKGEVPQRP